MKLFQSALFAGLVAAAAAPMTPVVVSAQQAQQPKDSSKKVAIPASARPPKGMCRIWLDGVPAAQQPAATDCPTAVKNRPQNGTVIFGDDFVSDSTKKGGVKTPPPNSKGFSGGKPVIFPVRPPE